MAGVEFSKCKLGAISGGDADIHFDLDKRSVCDHSNRSIDRALVANDYYIGNDWETTKQIMRDKVADADEYHPNKRKSSRRQELWMLEVPCPPELEDTALEDDFYKSVYDMYDSYLPLVSGEVHKDEKHDYYDPRKNETITSRNHMHLFGVCLTDDGRCHTSDFLTPQLCQRVNDDIQQLCLDKWGISYQTGEGRKGDKKTVEELKTISEVRLQEKLAREGLEIVERKKAEAEYYTEMAEIGREEVDKLQIINNNLQKTVSKTQADIADLEQKQEQLQKINHDSILEIQKMGLEAEEREAKSKAKANQMLAQAQAEAQVMIDNAKEHAVDIYLDKTRPYHAEELQVLKSITGSPDDRNAVQKVVDYMRDKANRLGVTLTTNLQAFEASLVAKLRIADSIYATQAEGISMYVGKNGLSDKQIDYISRQFDKMLQDNDPEHDWMRDCYNNQYGGADFKQLWMSRVANYCVAHPKQTINTAIPQINRTEQGLVRMSAGIANYLISSIQHSVDEMEYTR